ncbi:MAG TPA: SDR family NAD(P)-dependent oxidoreductase, partial [Thermoanaerobaculia bacterium]|nr:SDR family NAD(P)-dependent oxidoreductase [Thermoanaerobaculia bacterium]
AMLAVPLGELELSALMGPDVDLAALNGPARSVVSGPAEAIDRLAASLDGMGVATRRLRTSHAFHSAMMEPILDDFRAAVEAVALHAPDRAYLSNRSGTWIATEEATDPGYWADHVRNPVRFGAALEALAADPDLILLEVGPGTALASLARQHPEVGPAGRTVLSTAGEGTEATDAALALAGAVGRLWLAGLVIDWTAYEGGETRRRVPLPTYPFERQRFWIEPKQMAAAVPAGPRDVRAWLHRPVWTEAPAGSPRALAERWLLLLDDLGVGAALARRLEDAGCTVTTVTAGFGFEALGERAFAARPGSLNDAKAVSAALGEEVPDAIVHLWSLGRPDAYVGLELPRGVDALATVAQALGGRESNEFEIAWIASHAFPVLPGEPVVAERAAAVGLLKVTPQEMPHVATRAIDVAEGEDAEALAERLFAEFRTAPSGLPVALRGEKRFEQGFAPVASRGAGEAPALRFRDGGVYLVTGGLGRVGGLIAEQIARRAPGAKLALTARTPLPPRRQWDAATDPETIARIERVRALEALGAEVLVLVADAGDHAATSKALAAARAAFGPLHGVVHAAGQVRRGVGPLLELGPDDAMAQLEPKLGGLMILDELTGEDPLDFVLAVSSLAGVLGGLDFAAYAAANASLDAYAQERSRQGAPFLSIDWDGFRFDPTQPATRGFLGISPDEGRAVLALLEETAALPQILVATGDLSARVDQWLRRKAEPVGTTAARGGHARPASQGAYVAPQGEVETRIADLWSELLGIAEIGRFDNFFELGGDSLLAIQVAARLKKAGLDVTAQQLLSAPTIAELARALGAPGILGAPAVSAAAIAEAAGGVVAEEAAAAPARP